MAVMGSIFTGAFDSTGKLSSLQCRTSVRKSVQMTCRRARTAAGLLWLGGHWDWLSMHFFITTPANAFMAYDPANGQFLAPNATSMAGFPSTTEAACTTVVRSIVFPSWASGNALLALQRLYVSSFAMSLTNNDTLCVPPPSYYYADSASGSPVSDRASSSIGAHSAVAGNANVRLSWGSMRSLTTQGVRAGVLCLQSSTTDTPSIHRPPRLPATAQCRLRPALPRFRPGRRNVQQVDHHSCSVERHAVTLRCHDACVCSASASASGSRTPSATVSPSLAPSPSSSLSTTPSASTSVVFRCVLAPLRRAAACCDSVSALRTSLAPRILHWPLPLSHCCSVTPTRSVVTSPSASASANTAGGQFFASYTNESVVAAPPAELQFLYLDERLSGFGRMTYGAVAQDGTIASSATGWAAAAGSQCQVSRLGPLMGMQSAANCSAVIQWTASDRTAVSRVEIRFSGDAAGYFNTGDGATLLVADERMVAVTKALVPRGSSTVVVTFTRPAFSFVLVHQPGADFASDYLPFAMDVFVIEVRASASCA